MLIMFHVRLIQSAFLVRRFRTSAFLAVSSSSGTSSIVGSESEVFLFSVNSNQMLKSLLNFGRRLNEMLGDFRFFRARLQFSTTCSLSKFQLTFGFFLTGTRWR